MKAPDRPGGHLNDQAIPSRPVPGSRIFLGCAVRGPLLTLNVLPTTSLGRSALRGPNSIINSIVATTRPRPPRMAPMATTSRSARRPCGRCQPARVLSSPGCARSSGCRPWGWRCCPERGTRLSDRTVAIDSSAPDESVVSRHGAPARANACSRLRLMGALRVPGRREMGGEGRRSRQAVDRVRTSSGTREQGPTTSRSTVRPARLGGTR